MWQALRTELHPQGLEVVTVALDVDPEQARPAIEAAHPEHPSLIDSAHILDELLGVVNIPNAVWIDEEGMIVRPAEPAAIARPRGEQPEWRGEISPDLPERLQEMLREARKIPSQAAEYTNAIRDWVANGASSRFALPPDEVIERSGSRGEPEARAAALFELGQHLWHSDRKELSPKYWREAHRLQPDNWTYKRQAWSLADPLQGPTDLYDSDWLSDIRKVGPENYFPKLQL